MADYLDFAGNRATYRYYFIHLHLLPEQAGNYAFVKPVNGLWVPVYFGIADDLKQRLATHEALPSARLHGATHAVVHINRDFRERTAEEADLISRWNPVCNTQHRTAAAGTIYEGFWPIRK